MVAFIGYASSSDPWTMLLFRLLHGATMGLFTTVLLAMVTSLVPQRGLGLGMGIYQSSNATAQFYAAALAVWLTSITSVAFVFMIGAVVSGLALLFGMFVFDITHGVPVVWRPWRERQWISRTGLVPSLIFATMTTTVGALAAFLPLFVVERQLGNVGLFYSMFAFSLLPTRLLAGAISDRIGRGGVLITGLTLGSLTLALLSVTQSQTMLLLVALLYGISFGAVQITCVALVADSTPAELLGAGMATYTMAWDVGTVVGGVLLGPMVEITSYAVGFGLIAVLPLLGLWMYMTRMNGAGYSSLDSADAENRSSG
jgi:MFS family permease